MEQVSSLWDAALMWAASIGAKEISKLPGVWYGQTKQTGNIGPLDVRINAHKETIDGVPPFHASISMDKYFPGLIALVGPDGGVLMHSRRDGEDEAGLIAHFRAQTVN